MKAFQLRESVACYNETFAELDNFWLV